MLLNDRVKEVKRNYSLSLYETKLNKKFSQHYAFFEALSQYIDKAYLYLKESDILSRYMLLNTDFDIEFEVDTNDVLYSFGCYKIGIYFCDGEIFDYHESYSKFVGEGILNYCCTSVSCDYHIFRKDLYKTIYDILGCTVYIDRFQLLDNGSVSLPLFTHNGVHFNINNYDEYQKSVVTDLFYAKFRDLNIKNVTKLKFISKDIYYGCEDFLQYIQSNIYCKGAIIEGLFLNCSLEDKKYFDSKLEWLKKLENIKIDNVELYPFEYHIRLIKMGDTNEYYREFDGFRTLR